LLDSKYLQQSKDNHSFSFSAAAQTLVEKFNQKEKKRSTYNEFRFNPFSTSTVIARGISPDTNTTPQNGGFKQAAKLLLYVQINIRRHLHVLKAPSYETFMNRWTGQIQTFTHPVLADKVTVLPGVNGGIIEACPVRDGTQLRRVDIGFTLDLHGDCQLMHTAETIYGPRFDNVGLLVPQQSLKFETIQQIIKKIGWTCTAKNMVGCFTVQLHTWIDKKSGARKFWCTNMYLFFSPAILRAFSVLLYTGCKFSKHSGRMTFKWTDVPMHLTKTNYARFTNMKRLTDRFHNAIITQAGEGERRVALVIDQLRHTETARMTRRGLALSCERHGVRFHDWVSMQSTTFYQGIDLMRHLGSQRNVFWISRSTISDVDIDCYTGT
jgi:hypothetical protein